MVAPLRRVLVRRPATAGGWAGAAGATPDPDGLAAQHERFCALLDGLGRGRGRAGGRRAGRRRLHARPGVHDRRGGIPLRMAKPVRASEPGHARRGARAARRPGGRRARGPRYADGGDRFWIDERTMASGSATAPTARAPRAGTGWPAGRRRRSWPTTCRTTGAPAPSCTCSRRLGRRRGPARGLRAARARAAAGGPRERGLDWIASTPTSTSRWAATSSRCGRASW